MESLNVSGPKPCPYMNSDGLKSITFTVQIQADYPQGSQTKKATAQKLCHDINNILAKYDGVTGGVQIMPPPRKIKLTTTPDD